MKGRMAIIILIALVLGWIYYTNQSAVPTSEPDTYTSLSRELLSQLNEVRRQYGLPPFVENPLLTRAAFAHSLDMAFNNFFSHIGSDGSDLSNRLLRVGYHYSICAENILVTTTPTFSSVVMIWFIPIPIPQIPKSDYELAKEIVNSWMNSPGHRANILNPALHEIGIGIAAKGSKLYVTIDLGSR
ncbi:MAG: CAP domain-containing protein [Candidatus Methanomethylicaceae archaeon]